MQSPREGVVLALGGGGMRGAAHLGVLAEFAASGVPIAAIAGTSSGALLGALWVCEGSDGAIARLHDFVRSPMARRSPDLVAEPTERGWRGAVQRIRHAGLIVRALTGGHMLSREQLLDQVGFFLPDIAIEDMAGRFRIVATDSITGAEVWLDEGSLRVAVAASSAVPGVIAPLVWGDLLLQDGGAVAEIPVRAARALGHPVIAVEVSEALPAGDPVNDRLPRALMRAAAMGWQELRSRMLTEADYVLAPAVNHLHWSDFSGLELAVAAGRKSARDFLATGGASLVA